jgi:AhpD family alkylhydroperoxidase
MLRVGEPRIAPGTRAELGAVNALIARASGLATRGRPLHLFTTLGRHRGLFRRWLLFAGGLMPGGKLPRVDTELVILRVSHNCGCEYEWRHHAPLGRRAGLTAEEVERVRHGPDAGGWSPRRRALLRAADALHAERDLPDALWQELRPLLSDRDAIELCLLIGHYEMVAMTINGLRIQPEAVPA